MRIPRSGRGVSVEGAAGGCGEQVYETAEVGPAFEVQDELLDLRGAVGIDDAGGQRAVLLTDFGVAEGVVGSAVRLVQGLCEDPSAAQRHGDPGVVAGLVPAGVLLFIDLF